MPKIAFGSADVYVQGRTRKNPSHRAKWIAPSVEPPVVPPPQPPPVEPPVVARYATVLKTEFAQGMTLSENRLFAKAIEEENIPENIWFNAKSYDSVSAGKKYFEIYQTGWKSDSIIVGLANKNWSVGDDNFHFVGTLNGSFGVGLTEFSAWAYLEGAAFSLSVPPRDNPNVSPTVGFAIDFDLGKVWISVNGKWIGNNNDYPFDQISPNFTIPAGTELQAAISIRDGAAITANFGATEFLYSIPEGFEPWNPNTTYPPQEILMWADRLGAPVNSDGVYVLPTMTYDKKFLFGINKKNVTAHVFVENTEFFELSPEIFYDQTYSVFGFSQNEFLLDRGGVGDIEYSVKFYSDRENDVVVGTLRFILAYT